MYEYEYAERTTLESIARVVQTAVIEGTDIHTAIAVHLYRVDEKSVTERQRLTARAELKAVVAKIEALSEVFISLEEPEEYPLTPPSVPQNAEESAMQERLVQKLRESSLAGLLGVAAARTLIAESSLREIVAGTKNICDLPDLTPLIKYYKLNENDEPF